jgi:hypothetical protein
MFEDALRFPWNGEKKIETQAIGGVLTLLGVFVIPILFVYGYLVRVIRQTASGEVDEPPAFDDWGRLLTDGVVGFVITLVYTLIPGIVITVGALVVFGSFGVVGSAATDTGGGGALAVGGLLVTLLIGVVSLVLFLVAVYVVPAAVAAFARTGEFAAAFSPSVLRSMLTDRRYAMAWIVAVAIGILAQVVGGAVSATGVGAILVPFLTFYGNVAGAYAIGVGIADIDAVGASDEETPAGRPAV